MRFRRRSSRASLERTIEALKRDLEATEVLARQYRWQLRVVANSPDINFPAEDKPRRTSVPNEANVYRRADGRYEVGWRDTGGRQRWQSPFESLGEARAWRNEMLARVDRIRRGYAIPDQQGPTWPREPR